MRSHSSSTFNVETNARKVQVNSAKLCGWASRVPSVGLDIECRATVTKRQRHQMRSHSSSTFNVETNARKVQVNSAKLCGWASRVPSVGLDIECRATVTKRQRHQMRSHSSSTFNVETNARKVQVNSAKLCGWASRVPCVGLDIECRATVTKRQRHQMRSHSSSTFNVETNARKVQVNSAKLCGWASRVPGVGLDIECRATVTKRQRHQMR